MKRVLNLMMFACIMILAACSSDNDVTIENNKENPVCGEEITIGVGIPESDTRVSIDGLSLKWEQNDILIAIAKDGNGKVQTSEFKLVSGEGTANATFKGTTIPGATSYSLVYKSPRLKVTGSEYKIEYGNITQSSAGSQSQVRECLLISADNIPSSELKNHVKMNVKTSFLRLDVQSLPYGIYTFKDVKWFVNYGDETGRQNIQGSVKYKGKITTGSSNFIYIPFEPKQNLDKGGTIALQFVCDDRVLTVTGKSANGKTYSSGKMYKVTVSADDKAEKALTNWLIPADNNIWVRTVDGSAPSKDLLNGSVRVASLKQTAPNTEGWYEYVVDAGINKMGTAFMENTNIKEVWLSQTFRSITDNAFKGCTGLRNIIFPTELESIGMSAFYGCTALNNVVLPSKIQFIDTEAFYGCKSMTEFVVPVSVNKVGERIIDKTSVKKLTVKVVYQYEWDLIFGSSHRFHKYSGAFGCELYLHESWEPFVNGQFWVIDKLGICYKKIYLIDDNGNVVSK